MMNPKYRELLDRAQAEVREWRSSAPEASNYSDSIFNSLVSALEEAKSASTPEALERQLKSVIRMQMDQGPLTGDLMPSLSVLSDALTRQLRRRKDAS